MNQPPKWSILIADDDPTNREILTDAIEDITQDTTIEYASNGAQAADVAKSKIDNCGENFNIIFMDYQMPLMNGQEATRAIRQHEKSTGLADPKTAYIVTWSAARSTAYEGANTILSKPLLTDELSSLFTDLT